LRFYFFLIFFVAFHSIKASAEVRAVIFDMGGVVVASSNQGLADFLYQELKIAKNSLPKNLKEAASSLEKGLIDESEFWLQFASSRNGKVPEDWNFKWKEFYLHRAVINWDILHLVQTLRSNGYLTPLLSDTMESHYEINLERGLFDYFYPLFNSIHTHLVKPDPRAYEYVLSEIKVKPNEAVLIDDLKENVDAAINIGIIGLQYFDLSHLIIDFMRLNVKITHDPI